MLVLKLMRWPIELLSELMSFLTKFPVASKKFQLSVWRLEGFKLVVVVFKGKGIRDAFM